MLNSQNSNNTSNPTVAKLLEVDAELAAQEVELSAQMQSIQEKRHSLKTVIDLFSSTNTATTTPIGTPPEISVSGQRAAKVVEAESTAQDVATPEPNHATDTTDAKTPAVPDTQQQSKNKSSASKKSPVKFLPTQKTSNEQESWHQYLRDEFSNATLSQSVSEVMQQHSEQVLEIAAIVSAIFVNGIPQRVRSKARERVSNVLSVGVKKKKWYRGEAGKYSMSRAAI